MARNVRSRSRELRMRQAGQVQERGSVMVQVQEREGKDEKVQEGDHGACLSFGGMCAGDACRAPRIVPYFFAKRARAAFAVFASMFHVLFFASIDRV